MGKGTASPRQVCVMKDNSAALLISCPSDKERPGLQRNAPS